jgi:1-acyl-sn-glycerol-3-phosphate acyltransferase
MDLKQGLFYESLRFFGGPFLSLHAHLQSEGAENIPAEGGALLVANHRSVEDPLLIALSVDRFINFAAASFAFYFPVLKDLIGMAGIFPLNISGGRESRIDLSGAGDLLDAGELVGIFPEGIYGISLPDKVNRITDFRTGFLRLALEARVPVIPIAVVGLQEKRLPHVPGWLAYPIVGDSVVADGVNWVYYKRARVRIGVPIDLSPFYDLTPTKELIDRISGKVRRIVIKLYNGEDQERFLYGTRPFDIARDRV